MGKRSRKQPALYEKDNAGCLSALISIFDFRQGHYTQKLLSDRRHGSGRQLETGYSRSKLDLPSNIEIDDEDVKEVNKSEAKMDNVGMASVKTLMEEEMSRIQTQKVSSDEAEPVLSDMGLESHIKKNHMTSKNCDAVPNLHGSNLRVSANLDSEQCHYANPMERSSLNFDLTTLMVDFYSDNHHCQEKHEDLTIDLCPPSKTNVHGSNNCLDETEYQLAEKHISLQKALADIAKVFLSQNFGDVKQHSSYKVAQSKEFMDAVEILSSNKELFLKLIQDPDFLLLNHIQDLKNAQIGSKMPGEGVGISEQCKESTSHELLQKQSRHNFFRKKDRSKGSKSSKGNDNSQDTNKIVVLKPSPARIQNAPIKLNSSSSPGSQHKLEYQEDSKRVISHFSLKEIKRRLKNVIAKSRKERHLISMDGVLHKFVYGLKDSCDMEKMIGRESVGLATKNSCNTEHTSQPPAVAKKRDKKSKAREVSGVDDHKGLNMAPAAHPPHKETLFYEEAKKHLIEILATRDEKGSLPIEVISKSLGRILSLPENNLLSPRCSPGRDQELDSSSQQMRFSPLRQFNQENASDHLSPLRQDLESIPCTASNLDNEPQVIDSNPECIGEDVKRKENVEIEELEGNISVEDCNNLSVSSESIGNEANVICERCNEKGSSAPIPLVPYDEKPLLVIPSASPEGIMDKTERPSPVSVLEPFFLEDASSPGDTIIDNADLPLQIQQIYFEENDNSSVVQTPTDCEINRSSIDKEAMFDFVRTLLAESGLSCNETSERWHSSNQLLDPSLLDEVENSHDSLPDDPKLLFDFINEVLGEIQQRLFGCTLWISLIKPCARPMLRGGNLTQEVCKRLEKHLHLQFPATLDQIVWKDMEGGTWMELRIETETVLVEMGDVILEEIMEETMSELWV